MKEVKDVLKGVQGSTLATTLARAERLKRLEHALLQHLPDALRPHCQLGRFEKGVAVLLIDSPTWMTQARFQVPGILAVLKAQPTFADLQAIELKVAPPLPPSAKPAALTREQLPNRASFVMSADEPERLRAIAKSTDTPALAESLERLAKRAELARESSGPTDKKEEEA